METVTQIMVEAFHFPFRLGTVWSAHFQSESAVFGEIFKEWIELMFPSAICIALNNNGLHPKGTSSLRSGRILS